jgi:hypothetical protein
LATTKIQRLWEQKPTFLDAYDVVNALEDSGLEFYGDTKENLLDRILNSSAGADLLAQNADGSSSPDVPPTDVTVPENSEQPVWKVIPAGTVNPRTNRSSNYPTNTVDDNILVNGQWITPGDPSSVSQGQVQGLVDIIKAAGGNVVEGIADLGNLIFQAVTLGQGPKLEAVIPNIMDIINGGIGGTLVIGGGNNPVTVLGTGQTGIGRGTKVGIPQIPVIGPLISGAIDIFKSGGTLTQILQSIPSNVYGHLPEILSGAVAAGLFLDKKDKETLVSIGIEPSTLGGADDAQKAIDDAATAQKAIDDAATAQKAIDDAATAQKAIDDAATAQKAIDDAATAQKAIDDAATAQKAIDDAATTNTAAELPTVKANVPITTVADVPTLKANVPITTVADVPTVKANVPITTVADVPTVKANVPITTVADVPTVKANVPITTVADVPTLKANVPITTVADVPTLKANVPITTVADVPTLKANVPITTAEEVPTLKANVPITTAEEVPTLKAGPMSDAELDVVLTDLGGLPAVKGGYDTPVPKLKAPAPTLSGGGGGGGGWWWWWWWWSRDYSPATNWSRRYGYS